MKKDCVRIRKAIRSSAATPEEERHLFTCAACRADVQLGLVWKSLPRPSDLETRPAPDDAFIERVLRDVREDRRRRARIRTGLAAAAALIFFFFAGAAGRMAATASDNGDEAYAELGGSSDSYLETLPQ